MNFGEKSRQLKTTGGTRSMGKIELKNITTKIGSGATPRSWSSIHYQDNRY